MRARGGGLIQRFHAARADESPLLPLVSASMKPENTEHIPSEKPGRGDECARAWGWRGESLTLPSPGGAAPQIQLGAMGERGCEGTGLGDGRRGRDEPERR